VGPSLVLFNFDYAFMAPPSCQLGQSLALGHVGEFACDARAFTPFALTFSKMVNMLLTLHLSNIDSPCLDSLLDFQFDSNLELFMDLLRTTFLCMSQLLINVIFNMIFEHLQNSFDLEDLISGFIQLHQLCSHVVAGCILGSMA
jgi:hypothetical protein